MKNKEYTFFGSQKVPFGLKTELVDKLFSDVSGKYDLMNDLMSGGIHRLWKDLFCMIMDNPHAKLLDVAGGTCDVAKRFYEFCSSNNARPDITVCDLNYDMLSSGQDKLTNGGIFGVNFINANAENLPFANNSFDYYSVAFGIRNFTDIPKALKEARRVLKPGGKFLCLEFSKPKNMILNTAYSLYSKYVIPTMGGIMGDKPSYQYLVESIEKFPSQNEFADLIKDAGFSSISFRNISGGIVAIHLAYKE